METKTFERRWSVRVLRHGDAYGLNDCLIYDKEQPSVELYQDGKLAGRFRASDIVGVVGGLDLMGGYRIDHDTMTQIAQWVEGELS